MDWSSDVCSSDLRKVDRGLLALLVAARLGVLQIFTGQDDLAAQQQGAPVAVGVAFKPKGHRTCRKRGHGRGRIVDHADFQSARKSVVEGKGVCDRGTLGGRLFIKQKKALE